jgi:hypothetical protein
VYCHQTSGMVPWFLQSCNGIYIQSILIEKTNLLCSLNINVIEVKRSQSNLRSVVKGENGSVCVKHHIM